MKLLTLLCDFWKSLFPSKIDKINKKLEKAASQAVRDRRILKRQIELYVKRKFGFKVGSKFIPNKGYNKSKIHQDVLRNYNNEMSHHGIKLSEDLVWM